MGKALALLRAGAALSILVSLHSGLVQNAIDLAQVYAVTQLSINVACTLILGVKMNVWPGVTALMYRQIKLI